MNNQHIPEIKGEKTDQIKNQIALSTVCKPPTLQIKAKGKKNMKSYLLKRRKTRFVLFIDKCSLYLIM